MQYRMGSCLNMLYTVMFWSYKYGFVDMHNMLSVWLANLGLPSKESLKPQLDNPGSRSWNFLAAHIQDWQFSFSLFAKKKYLEMLHNFRATKGL